MRPRKYKFLIYTFEKYLNHDNKGQENMISDHSFYVKWAILDKKQVSKFI